VRHKRVWVLASIAGGVARRFAEPERRDWALSCRSAGACAFSAHLVYHRIDVSVRLPTAAARHLCAESRGNLMAGVPCTKRPPTASVARARDETVVVGVGAAGNLERELDVARLALAALLAVTSDAQFKSVSTSLEAVAGLSEASQAALEELSNARSHAQGRP
jgi:hypothetical protein